MAFTESFLSPGFSVEEGAAGAFDAYSAAQVSPPTMPSAVRFAAAWNAMTAARVIVPKLPPTVPSK